LIRVTKLGLLITASLAATQNLSAQGQYDTTKWRFSNPSPFGFTVLDVDFIDDNNVIAVGDVGGIARSRDGGKTWTYGAFVYNSAAGQTTRSSFSDVHAVNNQVAYAVGSGGAMAKTTNGGASWSFVRTPLFDKARNINTVWFISPTVGYIGGQHNTPDSIPKVYVTRDGGSSWDSLAAPTPVQSRVGYVNNSNVGWRLVPADAKDKEILRIKFVNDSIGYISGSGLSTFLPIPNVNATTGLPTGTNTSTGGHHASLLWKISSGRITDYSTTKERLGYGGTTVSPVTVSSRYGQPSLGAVTQSYRAMHIENDSTVLIMSFNNNIVLRVRTGRNDSTVNPAQPGRRDAGRYEVLNFPFPPLNAPAIPNPQTLNVSNPYEIKRAANGKLYASAGFGLAATSTNNGNTWVMENILPQGRNFSQLNTPALDISPSGRFLTMGFQGVNADSVAGGRWQSDYVSVPLSGGYAEMEFADCNTAIATGGSNITVTRDGGKTWIDKRRADFANLFINITGLALPEARRAYFTTNAGTLYLSTDTATTLDPLYSNPNFQFNDVSAVGKDTVYVVGYSSFSVAAASRTSKVFRSTNRGTTWQELGTFPTGVTAPNLSKLAFPSSRVGYTAGSRGGVFKTTDGGSTWTNISPFPSTNTTMSYTEVFAVDDNTVFLTGNQFPRNVVYKSLDGGTTWTDVTSNLPTLSSGNINGLLMQDANNGYIVRPGGVLHTTNNGGASWNIEVAPTSCLFETIAFAPKTVPAGTPMNRRRLFVTGANLPNGGAPMMEFGDPSLTVLNSTETVTGASCTAPNAGSVTVTATGGLTPYSYSADGVNFQTSNILTGLTRGEKTIFIREAGCGTTITKRVTIPFTDNLTLTANNDTTVCLGGTITLRAATNGAGSAFSWTPAAGLGSPNNAITTAVVSAPTTYTVTATLNGCTRTEPVVVQTLNIPNIYAGPDATIISGDDYLMQATTTSSLKSITWTPSTALSNPNVLNPTAVPVQTTTYRLTVVENGTDCISSDEMVITVIPNCLKVMNAFTPNGDGVNDRWQVTTADVCTRNVNVTVFNRYGQMVYTNKNYTNVWDGTANGKPLPDGTYYYSVRYTLVTGKVVELKGDVTILR
jgi:gliding motility-associated-like protein